MSTFELRIVTPSGLFYSGEIEYLSVQATDGREGFMRGAIPRVGILCEGRIEIKTSVINKSVDCGNGIIQVRSDGITLITESAKFTDVEQGRDDADSGELSSQAYASAKSKIVSAMKNMHEKKSATD